MTDVADAQLPSARRARDPAESENSSAARDTHAVNETSDWAADFQLVRGARAGERDSVAAFVERMRCIPRILEAKNARAGRPLAPEDLADAAQQVFGLVWARTDAFRGESTLETWVYSFCNHVFLDALRSRRRASGAADVDGLAVNAEPRAIERLDEEQLHRALAALDPGEARVVELKQMEDLTFAEIAALLSIPVNTAKSRYYRGLATLRERLRGWAPEEGR